MLKKAVVLGMVSILLSACSAFRSPKESISIMTNQPDAVIFVNGQRVGSGFAVTRVKRNHNVQIMARKEGYQAAYYNVDSNLNVTGVLDIVGTFFFIVPLIGVFFPGSKSLDQNNVALDLEPISLSSVVK